VEVVVVVPPAVVVVVPPAVVVVVPIPPGVVVVVVGPAVDGVVVVLVGPTVDGIVVVVPPPPGSDVVVVGVVEGSNRRPVSRTALKPRPRIVAVSVSQAGDGSEAARRTLRRAPHVLQLALTTVRFFRATSLPAVRHAPIDTARPGPIVIRSIGAPPRAPSTRVWTSGVRTNVPGSHGAGRAFRAGVALSGTTAPSTESRRRTRTSI
jgi:hypothetical protein